MNPTNLDWAQLVHSDGQLNRERVTHIEIIYTGLHGQSVQRFRLKDGQSYIYKPLPPGDKRFREIKAYVQIMPLLAELVHAPTYPALIAYGAPAEQLAYWRESSPSFAEPIASFVHPACWMIAEDSGVLDHQHSSAVLEQVIEQMACWHTVGEHDLIALPQSGQKPPLHKAAASLFQRWEQVQAVIQEVVAPAQAFVKRSDGLFASRTAPLFPLSAQLLSALYSDLRAATERIGAQRSVLLHGDLHAGNYGINPHGTMIVLDWEHSHAGSLFWDVYHLLDLSHPLFPRLMTAELRHRLLERYWIASSTAITAASWQRHAVVLAEYADFAGFKKDYVLYTILYSLWMLLLIRSDLRQQPPIWPHALLLAQQYETQQHLGQCLVAWQAKRTEI
ncbi:phosphotransferase family protein [Paenibacillus campi]|uniref:phosphotransferase family protein n=1 Tax=Paenibacillus campi TaxID=3106031 RepID=UPI002AFDE5A6|nr:phosphotransferase [Paenibacillus sp. SGZ-1014]